MDIIRRIDKMFWNTWTTLDFLWTQCSLQNHQSFSLQRKLSQPFGTVCLSSSYTFHQEAASPNNNSQLPGKLLPSSRQDLWNPISQNKISFSFKIIFPTSCHRNYLNIQTSHSFLNVLIWFILFFFIPLKLHLRKFLPFGQVLSSVWSVCQQSFGPIMTLPLPHLKPQSLLESDVCFSHGKEVFLFFFFLLILANSFSIHGGEQGSGCIFFFFF